ncbi:hypothetical protein IG631_16428 [Alternaria alternata]|nr:hypothetical protein IG631_16428 [Alternaria alternata]
MIDHSWRWGAGDVEFAAKNGPVSWHRPQLGVTPSASPRQWACFPASDRRRPSTCGLAGTGKVISSYTQILTKSPTPALFSSSRRDTNANAVACRVGNDWRVASSIQELSRQN